MEILLNPRQMEVFTSTATEILYGGAAGGGKSYLMRALAVALCYDVSGLQVYLFRRTYPDLMANHMNGYMSFPEMLGPMVDKGQVKIRDDEIRFANGSKIHLCHCQHEKDVIKYQGAEIHVLLVDELTHFSEYMYRFLRNRVRIGGLLVPEKWRGRIPLILCGSNPGGLGHAWVKRSFVTMNRPYEVVEMPDEEGGMLRQYIPAKLSDNPVLVKNDPKYVKRLAGLGNEDLIRAMMDGDWDIVAGAAFETLSRERHGVRAFEIPHWWTRFMSIDWGSSKPYSVGWYAVADEQVVLKATDRYAEKVIGKGSIICYRELYGWTGKEDEGTREESWEVARKIAAMETPEEEISYRIGDSAMWAKHDGPSTAERFTAALMAEGAKCPYMEQSRKDRKANYLEIRERLSLADGENPGLYVFDNCLQFWRTVPELQLDEWDPEKGWDTSQEDHWADQLGYALASRPVLTTKREYERDKYEEARNAAFDAERGGRNVSRY